MLILEIGSETKIEEAQATVSKLIWSNPAKQLTRNAQPQEDTCSHFTIDTQKNRP